MKILFLPVFLALSTPATGQKLADAARIPENDRVRLAEAFRIADQYSDKLWHGWNKIPFAILLVTPETEFLVRHPNPSEDFVSSGYDSLIGDGVFARPRTFDTGLLATFPAVGGISTVVVGQAENTQAERSSRWVLTLLHEHFHQLQQSQTDYYESVNKLNLSRGDQSGMWMLNYAFPYDSVDIHRQFSLLARALRQALLAPAPEFAVRLNRYTALREDFRSMLSDDDYRYFSFQLWQEGAARYTEVRLCEFLADDYTPTSAFRSLPDYRSFKDEFAGLRREILSQLRSVALHEIRRSAFYPFGAAEALLLDRSTDTWRDDYFSRRFDLTPLFPKP